MARKAGLPKKRNGVYYANETYRGIRLRDCLHTDSYAQANENLCRLRTQVDEGKRGVLSNTNCEWLKISLAVVLDALHAEHVQAGRKEGGLRIMRERAKPLKRLLGNKLLRKIENDDLLQYGPTDRRKAPGSAR